MRVESQSIEDGEFRPRYYSITDEEVGLQAFVVVDDTSLGPAAGGIRTRTYPSLGDALDDARALARSMTYKCALAGLQAGGGKGVVVDNPGLDRDRAFERLGSFIESLGGEMLTAGDLGTNSDDLAAMARQTRHVYTDEAGLSDAVGRGCLRAIEACVDVLGDCGHGDHTATLAGLTVSVQGCGSVGSAVARAARAAGADLLVADLDTAVASRLAEETAGVAIAPEIALYADAEIVAPCAVGGVVTDDVAADTSTRAICGAANNILAAPAVEDRLIERGILYVPGPLSSSGAVIEGVGRFIMGLDDCGELIDRVRQTTRGVLHEAREQRCRAGDVARETALALIRAARA
jgi:leucine dehydrogenase